jgi:adenosylcobinamide-phosphate synthase
MSFFAVLLALLLDQARPMNHQNPVHVALRTWIRWVKRSMDAGQSHHGVLVWFVAVGLPVIAAAAIHMALWTYSVVLTLAWDVAVLYLTLGFRQFSHHFTEIRNALERGDEGQARRVLAQWKRIPVERQPESELMRHAIEHSVLAVHQHVLGVLVCFVLCWMVGLGPAGAVLFRLADYLAQACSPDLPRTDPMPTSESVCQVATKAWAWVNYLPARATALAFAVVGNFEEAVASWRQDAVLFNEPNQGIVLAATAGALNVRLGRRVGPSASSNVMGGKLAELASPDANALGREPQLAHLASLVGLVWRSVVLWLVFLALLTLANLVG